MLLGTSDLLRVISVELDKMFWLEPGRRRQNSEKT